MVSESEAIPGRRRRSDQAIGALAGQASGRAQRVLAQAGRRGRRRGRPRLDSAGRSGRRRFRLPPAVETCFRFENRDDFFSISVISCRTRGLDARSYRDRAQLSSCRVTVCYASLWCSADVEDSALWALDLSDLFGSLDRPIQYS